MKSSIYLYKFLGIPLFALFSLVLNAQVPTTCAVSAAPPIVHSEGLAERIGDIVLTCTGTPGTSMTAHLNVSVPVTITNRINASGYATDASLSINTGSGNVPSGIAGRVTNQMISFDGFQFTIPASGIATLVVDDIRADVNQLGLVQQSQIYAYLGSSLALQQNSIPVALAQQGLLATSMDAAVTCTGSPTPATISVTNLMAAKTAVETTRVTEGFPNSFQPKDSTSDTGTRFLLTYAGIPAGATVYVPDAVAGSTAAVPTVGGDFSGAATAGQYIPGSHTLLLVRVLNADSTGAGGTLAMLPAPNSSGAVVLDGANPVAMTNGSGYAVYEVADASQSATETAQIPNFYAIPAKSPASSSTGGVSLAPVSAVGTASTNAPIPRFANVTPPSDCSVVGDCSASYYPQLQATATSLAATGVTGGKKIGVGNITIRDTRGGVLDWTVNVTYADGSGWISLTQPFGVDGALVQVYADPSSLSPGTYQATISIDAGPIAGTQSFPLTFTVTAATPSIVVTSVTNAADDHAGPVAPGSLATIWGSNLDGQNVSVAFDGTAAKLLYTGAQQINLMIPASLSGKSTTQMVVSANGKNSAPYTVNLTSVAPAIFTPGILNQDYSVNSTANPAKVGTYLQIFLTGLPDTGAAATVTIQNRNLAPAYAGAAPGLMGLEQVNVALPADLEGVTSNLTICAAGSGNQQYCSQPEAVALKP